MMAAPFRHFPELIGDKPAIQVMHEMTSNPTAGMIRHILPGIPPHDTLVMILNALHARGHWIKDGTANKDTNVVEIADEKVEVNRPSDQQHKTPFFQSSAIRATLSCFPLCNSEADDIHSSLLVVTPDADVCCDDQAVAAWLSSFEWKQLRQEIAQLEAGGTSDVPVALPRFTLERHLELKNVLELLGLQSYFDSRSADFGYLTARSGVSFAQMTHKAKLMVSADGVEAAAAGATLMSGPAFLPDGRPRSSTARKPSSRINQQQSGDSLRHRGPAYVVLFYAIPGFAPGHSIPLFFGLFGRRCEHGSFLPSDAAHEHVLRYASLSIRVKSRLR
ncbi:serpin B9-like [Tropilaelaps mercedesae]|uniref:Serpin B9-like n=1 Tax=Tropilaelaps mercedesae TaxID=418985 RepID=A0A1V9WZT8_9ACAR|nr:serpin B9-like [Tropilaelaps mercedesae]